MTCIIVVGCFRSGTSIIAGVLHHLGIPMGKKFDEPNQNNMFGFWEDVEFKEFHKAFDVHSRFLPDEEYSALVKSREDEYPLWGVKDPLLCRNLNNLISCLKTPCKVIACTRQIKDIGNSMAKASGNTPQFPNPFNGLAQFYVDCMYAELSQYHGDLLMTNHDQVLLHPHETVNRIAEFCEVPVTQAALEHIRT